MKSSYNQLKRVAMVETNMGGEKQDEAAAEPIQTPAPEILPEYDTGTLFAGRREIIIHHGGAAYRMKITKQGKLILNK